MKKILFLIFFLQNNWIIAQGIPKECYKSFVAGHLAHQEKKDEEAIKHYDEVIKNCPQYGKAYTNKAAVYIRQNRYKEAQPLLDKAISLYPKDTIAYMYKGEIARKQGDTMTAIKNYNKVLELNPDDALILTRRGMMLIFKSPEKGIIDIDKALKLEPENFEANVSKGVYWMMKLKPTEGLTYINKALEINPADKNAIKLKEIMMGIQKQLGDTEKSPSSSENKASNSTTAVNAYNSAAKLQEQNKYQDAIIGFDKAIAMDKNMADAYFNRGKCYENIEKYEAAVKDFLIYIKLVPNDADAYLGCAYSYLQLDKNDESIAMSTKAIALAPKEPLNYLNITAAYSKKDDYNKIIEWCNKAIASDVKDAKIYLQRAFAYQLLEKPAETLQDVNKSLLLDATNAEAHYLKAMLLADKKNYNDALSHINIAVKTDKKNNLDIVAYKSYILVLLEKKQEAKILAQSVLKKEPNNEIANIVMKALK